MALYRVIVKLKNEDQYVCRFRKKTSARVFKQIGEKYLVKAFDQVEGIYIARVDKPTGPSPDLEKPPGDHWCPYCISYRHFKLIGGYTRCEVCWVSDKEYWVKRYNQVRQIWRKSGGKKRWRLYQE